MLEPYDGKLSRTVLRREGGGNTADPADYSPLVNRLKGQVIHISPASTQYINPMDINSNYSEEDNPLALKADFVLSLCELVVGGKEGLQPVEKTVIDLCVHVIYRKYFENPTPENMPLLEDLYNALLTQDEPEARHVAAALEIYVKGSLNIFNHHTNVDINNRIVCFDIKERTATRSPPKKSKVEQSKPQKQKLKLDADKAAEKAQHLRFGKVEITPDEASRMTKQQKRAMYAAAAARSAVHREVDQYEDDNVGTQALNEGVKSEEGVSDFSKNRYARKLKKKAKLQAKKNTPTAKSSAFGSDKAQSAEATSSEGNSNWFSRWRQK